MTIVKKVHDTSKMWSTLAPMHIQYDELRAKNDENENLYHKHKTMAKELQESNDAMEELVRLPRQRLVLSEGHWLFVLRHTFCPQRFMLFMMAGK
jgi:hypothetical protein